MVMASSLLLVIGVVGSAQDVPVVERKDVVLLLDPSLKPTVPILVDSFERLGFRAVRTVDEEDRGPWDTGVEVIAGNKKAVKDWLYLIEIGKPLVRPGGLGGGVTALFPYALHYRPDPKAKPTRLAAGTIYSWHRTAEDALFGFAERGCSSQLGYDISLQLGAGLLTGKPWLKPNPPSTPIAWFPAELVDGGETLKVVLKNKNPVTLQVSVSVQSSPQDTRSANYPAEGRLMYLGAGEERTLLLPVSGMSGIVPGCVTCTAYVVDERVTLRDSRRDPAK